MASRLTAGSAETTNLYGQIDRDKVHGLNVDQPSTSASAAAASSEARTGLAGEGRGGRGKGEAKEMIKEWDARGDESVWVESQDGVSPACLRARAAGPADRHEPHSAPYPSADPELIVSVPFTQNVRVRSLLLKTARGEEAPAVVRLYANRPDGARDRPASLPVPHIMPATGRTSRLTFRKCPFDLAIRRHHVCRRAGLPLGRQAVTGDLTRRWHAPDCAR
jgi:hypothetical protein